MTEEYKMDLYFMGVPTRPEFVTQEHLDLIDEENVVFFIHDNPFKDFDGYNFFREYEFRWGPFENVHLPLEKKIKRLAFKMTSWKSTWEPRHRKKIKNEYSSPLQDALYQIKQALQYIGDVKVVFCTYGNLHHSKKYVYELARRHDRDNWPTHLINTRSSTNDDIEIFYTLANIILGHDLPSLPYENQETEDHTGIFFGTNTLPSLEVNPGHLYDILDNRAQQFINTKNLILWSGGTDSTAIVAAFAKNNVPFKVTVSNLAREENPEMYDYIIQNYDYIEIDDTLDLTSLDSDYLLIHGGCADCIFPRCRWDQKHVGENSQYHPFSVLAIRKTLYADENRKFKRTNWDLDEAYELALQPVSMQEIQENHEYWSILSNQLINRRVISSLDDPYATQIKQYLDSKIAKWPLPVVYHYQLVHMFRYIFSYYDASNRMLQRAFKLNDQTLVDFYDNPEIEKWSLINFEDNMINYSETPGREKYILKEYAYSYFNVESILEKTKFPSLFYTNTVK